MLLSSKAIALASLNRFALSSCGNSKIYTYSISSRVFAKYKLTNVQAIDNYTPHNQTEVLSITFASTALKPLDLAYV